MLLWMRGDAMVLTRKIVLDDFESKLNGFRCLRRFIRGSSRALDKF
jgi:hypothetical protein